MRLKYLELQGYKSFASRTEFIFDGGITAIVGPNGSGKSNIADAIRWVLGEQSYRSLRGKRTEDMIFSGSAVRARLGMAMASLTLDNVDGWLPIDFSEVTIARRAYRSGENEYLLNGSRVRLRDITELLAKSGLARRTYTVIGQGLVDDVLSLRPEDRRALIEEAAGVSLYQAKRAETLARLEETRSNLLRINDIINEIAPRLRRLEREAERAERYTLLSQQLEGLLRTWYGYRWRREQRGLLRARDALARREATVQRCRENLEALDERMSALRTQQIHVREHLGSWHRESGDLRGQMEQVQRDLAVWQERARLLGRQIDDHEADLAPLEAQAQAIDERLATAHEHLAKCEATLRKREELLAQAQAKLDAHEGRRASLSQDLTEAETLVLDLKAQIKDHHIRLAQLGERRADAVKERSDHLATLSEHQARAQELAEQIRSLSTWEERLQGEREAIHSEAKQLAVALGEARRRHGELQARMTKAQHNIERLQSRHDLLTRLRQEGEGLRRGTRAVLRAAGKRGAGGAAQRGGGMPAAELSGILGTVAQLVHVPTEYEIAIEAVLGEHLQDLVVESWSDAEAAIAYLRAQEQGRATFLPLDTVRPAPRLEVARDQYRIGVAADLVQAEERLTPIVDMLLGHVVVVRDLETARHLLRRRARAARTEAGRTSDAERGGWQAVTLLGEVLRSSGSITGGETQSQAQGQVLSREREWRELPRQVESAQVHHEALERALDKAQATEERLSQKVDTVAARRQEIEQALLRAQGDRRDVERDAAQIAQQIAWHQGLSAQLEDELQEIDAAESSLQSTLADLEAEAAAAERRTADLRALLEELRGEVLYQQLSEARTAEAIARGTWEHRRTALEGLRDSAAQLEAQMEAKSQRIRDIENEQTSLAEQIAKHTSREAVIQGWLTSLAQKIDPAEEEALQIESERDQLLEQEGSLRSRLREAESNHAQALLAKSRQEDRLERLRQQIMDDFGLVEMEPMEGVPEQPPLPLGELVSALPTIETLPEGLEEEIQQIKAQLRRIGPTNPGAPEEYGETLDRYTFLTTQATDLEEAARSLRQVISELDDVMRREFHATFDAIATRFEESFARLFGGGTARLVLTDPSDVHSTGIDIVARPPGKRQQALALLSGGERALTAAALIFSILEASPPPFCVLDEVDAMLDEANIKRFRQALEALAQDTQCIVITHNRGTIQAANTLYGVSMGDDSVSQVVSLQLDGDRIARPDGSTVEMKTG